MTKLKPTTPVLQRSGVVYKIPCKNCPTSYIGQTKQLLRKRLNGHKYNVGDITALKNHQNQTGKSSKL